MHTRYNCTISPTSYISLSVSTKVQGTEGTTIKYDVDQFVEDAFGMKITPFLLDTYAQEYQQMIRAREAHIRELNELRNNNRLLSAQV